MKMPVELVLLLFIILVSSGCATLSSSEDYSREPINWRDYNDC